MKRFYFECKNGDCDGEESLCCITCHFKLRAQKCCETDTTVVSTQNEHSELCHDHPMKTRGLDFKVKEDIDKIRNEHKSGSFRPALIRDALLDLHYTEDQLPHINVVQNYVSYQKKLHSGNHDIQSFNHQLQQLTQQDATHMYDAFVYGTCIAEDGTVKVGSGHENDHFHASFTSNRLLANIRGAQEHNDIGEWPMTFCIDFTFKTNLLGFFFGVMGVVDACRHFFLGAITLLSHKTTADYETSIADFKRICLGAGKFVLSPTYCMLAMVKCNTKCTGEYLRGNGCDPYVFFSCYEELQRAFERCSS